MKFFTRQWRVMSLAAVLAVAAVCWVGCGGGDNPANGGNNNNGGGNNTNGGGSDTTGNGGGNNNNGGGSDTTSNGGGSNNGGGNNNNGGGSNNNGGGSGSYESVVIGGKTWMKKNLNIETPFSRCYGYEGSADSCAKYGRLYSWYAAKTACPAGWHLPTRDEWGALAIAAGGTGTYGEDGGDAGTALKSTSGWKEYNGKSGNGTDTYGFAALPGGTRGSDGRYYDASEEGYWWTATEDGSGEACYRQMVYLSYNSKDFGVEENTWEKDAMLSVRCVLGGVTVTPIVNENKCTSAATCKSKKMPDGKTWMTENLNIATAESWCNRNSAVHCAEYGRLYTWSAAKTACPKGWHLPTSEEWNALTTAAGGSNTAGNALKSTFGWYGLYTGTDKYGFAALPGGYYDPDPDWGGFGSDDKDGSWWTATESEFDSSYAYRRNISVNYESVGNDNKHKGFGQSVRCIAD